MRVYGNPEPQPCEHCGELIPVKFEDYKGTRSRFYSPEEHDCEPKRAAYEAKRQAAIAAAMERFRHPTADRIKDVRAHCGLPPRSFPGLRALTRTEANAAAIEAAEAMVDRFRAREREQGLYLWGPVGTGKTAILGALAFDLYHWTSGEYHHEFGWIASGGGQARVQYWNLPDFFAQMKRSYDGEGRYDPDVIEGLDVILWDDAGKQYSTEHNFSEFFRWIDWFYSNRKAICFSSNYSPEDLGSRLAYSLGSDYAIDIAAMIDRIRGECDVIELSGKSWRQQPLPPEVPEDALPDNPRLRARVLEKAR